MRERLSFANVMSVIAVFIALGGSAIAINKVKPNSVGTKQLKNNAVTSPKVANGSLLGEDFAAGQLPAGAKGQTGATGATGPPGQQGNTGPPGAQGSPDTGAQILAKLAAVDGNGSGLDADRLDGLTSSDFTDLLAPKGETTVHVVGAGGEPPFQNSFASGPGHGAAGFFRDGFGVVHLQGTLRVPATPSATAFTLPAGYRPEAGVVFVAYRFADPGSIPQSPMGVLIQPAASGDLSLLTDGTHSFALNDEVNLDGITFRCSPSGANGCP